MVDQAILNAGGGCPVTNLTLIGERATGCCAVAVWAETPFHEINTPYTVTRKDITHMYRIAQQRPHQHLMTCQYLPTHLLP